MEIIDWKGHEIFDPAKCDRCGKCLAQCPVLEIDENGGKREIENLIRGRDLKPVIETCTSCFACDLFCASGLRPYELILWRWNQRYLEKGLPGIARYVMPDQPLSIWSNVKKYFSDPELKNLSAWKEAAGAKEVIYTGAMTCLFPYLMESNLFQGLTVVGTEEFWTTGALYYQLGLFDLVEKIGRLVKERFKRMGVEKVVPFYMAEYVMLKKIYPEIFGIEFDFELVDLETWLLDRIKTGEIKLTRKLDLTVTMQDSCWSKALGAEFFDRARELVSLTGARIVEMKNHREHSLCCGFGSGAGRFSPLDISRGIGKRLLQAKATAADAIVTHCTGCLFVLSVGLAAQRSKLPIYHLSQLLAMAAGEDVQNLNTIRGNQILRAIIFAGIRHPLLLMKRFRPQGPVAQVSGK